MIKSCPLSTVTAVPVTHLISYMRTRITRSKNGMSLVEVLCVVTIIAILAALYLGAIARAFRHILKFLNGF
jgi:prepilin-type N-terminal cleavage/methylation domain-containing protein